MGVPRNDDQAKLWGLGAKGLIRFDRQSLLRVLRAAGQENNVVRRNAGKFAQLLCSRIVAVARGTVEFQRASDGHAIGWRPQSSKSIGVFRRLNGDAIDSIEGRSQ